jgi:hypothetical protein
MLIIIAISINIQIEGRGTYEDYTDDVGGRAYPGGG